LATHLCFGIDLLEEHSQTNYRTAAQMLKPTVSPGVLLALAIAGFGLQGYDTVSHGVAAAWCAQAPL
jgi:hypothetical protein